MSKSKKSTLGERIKESLDLIHMCEVLNPQERVRYVFRIMPFEKVPFAIIVEDVGDAIIVTGSIRTTKKIMDSWKETDDAEKNRILGIFGDVYHRHQKELTIRNDFDYVESHVYLLSHNLSHQRVLDEVQSNIILAKDVFKLLAEIDSTLSAPISTKNTENMFR